jgi:hypothetical protein
MQLQQRHDAVAAAHPQADLFLRAGATAGQDDDVVPA